jgi:hypothetical protein
LQESQESLQKRSARDEEIDLGMIMSGNEDSLVVLWTSGDREVALNMVFMYTPNSKLKNWWSEVRLIVWGPSSGLLSEDKDLQDEIRKMKNAGVILEACKACADKYGVSQRLEQLGVQVRYMGQPLTD